MIGDKSTATGPDLEMPSVKTTQQGVRESLITQEHSAVTRV